MSVPPPSAAKPLSVPPPRAATEPKSPARAFVLSLLFTGAGHWYIGEPARGAAFLLGTVVVVFVLPLLVGLVVSSALAVAAALDARQRAT